jgi:succinyl-CoA synthetase beta subunit
VRRRHCRDTGAARATGDGPVLDELASGALLDRLGIARVPSVVLGTDIGRASSLPFPYPVAVKALCAEIAHKSDVGGVELGISDGDALIAAIRKIVAAVAQHRLGARLDRVLVQPMVSGLGEVLLGYRVDRDVGPLIMLATGGLLAEIMRDRSLRLAPIDLATAQEMIAEVRGLNPLAGYRGRPKGDLDALAHVMIALAKLADDPSIAEAEINPLIVRPAGQGVIAVDALVKLAANA